jgi:hypothetical protein
MRTEASAAGSGPDREPEAAAGWGRGVAAGLLAAVAALALINLAALPGLAALLPLVVVLPALICIVGPVVEETCKYGAFRLMARPTLRGWRAYWALGLTFGALEALLKLAPLLLGAPDGAPTLPLPGGGAFHARIAGALTSLLLHSALGGLVAVAATGRGGRGGLALLLAIVIHMGFNTLPTLAVVALDRVAGEPGAALAVWLALLLAVGVALLPFAMPRRRHGAPAVAPPPPPVPPVWRRGGEAEARTGPPAVGR